MTDGVTPVNDSVLLCFDMEPTLLEVKCTMQQLFFLLCTVLFHCLWKTGFQARLGPIPQVSAFYSNSVSIGHFRNSVNTDFLHL